MELADGVRPAKTTPEGQCPKTRAKSLVKLTVTQDESGDLEDTSLSATTQASKLGDATATTATDNNALVVHFSHRHFDPFLSRFRGNDDSDEGKYLVRRLTSRVQYLHDRL